MISAGEILKTQTDVAGASYEPAVDVSVATDSASSEGAFDPCVTEMFPDEFAVPLEQSVWTDDVAAPKSVVARPVGQDDIELRLDILKYGEAEKAGVRKLVEENLRRIVEPGLPYEGGKTVSAPFTAAEFDQAFDDAIRQFSELRATAFANGLPIERLPEVVEAGLSNGILVEDLPTAFKDVYSEEAREELAQAIVEGAKEEAASVAEIKGPARDSFRARGKMAGTVTTQGLVAWFAAEKLAGAIGISNPTLRFGFVIYTMHYGTEAMNAAIATAKAVRAGESAGEALRIALGWKVAGEAAGARALSVAKNLGKVPLNLPRGIGVGLLMSKLTAEVAETYGMDPEIAGYVSTAAFFSEAPINVLSKGRFMAACDSLGIAAAGEVAAVAMLAEVGAEGAFVAMNGDDSDYMLSMEQRASEKFDDRVWEDFVHNTATLPAVINGAAYVSYGVEQVVESIVGFFLPGTVRRAKALGYHKMKGLTLDDTLGGDEFIKKESEDAIKKSRELPAKLRGALELGLAGDDIDPAFYEDVDLEWIGETVDLSANDNAKDYVEYTKEKKKDKSAQGPDLSSDEMRDALFFLKAHEVSQTIASLHFAGFTDESLRKIFDRDGFNELEMNEDMDEAFFKEYVGPAFEMGSDASVEEIKSKVLTARKKNLVAAILGARSRGDEKREKELTDAAIEVGVMNAAGEFDKPIYSATIEELVKSVMTSENEAARTEAAKVIEQHRLSLELMLWDVVRNGRDSSAIEKDIYIMDRAGTRAMEGVLEERAEALIVETHFEKDKIAEDKNVCTLEDKDNFVCREASQDEIGNMMAAADASFNVQIEEMKKDGLTEGGLKRAQAKASATIVRSYLPQPGK